MSDSSARSRSDAAATRRWVARLESFVASNHRVVAFCAAEGVSESNFYLWKRRLAQPHATAPNQPKVVPIRRPLLPRVQTFLSNTTAAPDRTLSVNEMLCLAATA